MSESEDILLSKWLENELSQEEKHLLEQQYDLESLALILEKQKSTELQTLPTDKLWERLDTQLSNEAPSIVGDSKLKRNLAWSALILFLIALGGYFLMMGGETKIESENGQRKEYLMADGSRILIAPGSSITFNEGTWFSNREIQLTGQAFFDVAKGETFLVETKQGKVKVLGTEFEIWESGIQMKVHCFEGSVSVSNLSGAEKILQINGAVDLNNQQLSDVYKHGMQDASFTSDQMKYRSINVASLATELERFYNIRVRLEKIDLSKNFTGILVINDLEKATEYLAKTMNWNYDLKEKNLTFSAN